MAKGRAYNKPEEKVKDWQASGKPMSVWCRENDIPVTTFCGWKKRLEKHEPKNVSIQSKTKFIELKNRELSESGISLECNGIKIHLKTQFDFSTLKQCLEVLRGVTC